MLKTRENKELFDLFDGNIICGDNTKVKQGKPCPDIFLVAAELLGHDMINMKDCLVFEDAPSVNFYLTPREFKQL